MVTEILRETSTKEVFEEVSLIEGPGHYRLDSLGSDRPYFEQNIPHLLREKFPHIWTTQFHSATLNDGRYTPARLEYSHALDYLKPDSFIGIEGKIFYISFGSQSSNGYGSWFFTIKDVGDLSVVENKLEITRPENRDGEVVIRLSGTAPHSHRHTGNSWRGWLDVKGEKPGILVEAVIEHINDVKASSNIPLWKAL